MTDVEEEVRAMSEGEDELPDIADTIQRAREDIQDILSEMGEENQP